MRKETNTPTPRNQEKENVICSQQQHTMVDQQIYSAVATKLLEREPLVNLSRAFSDTGTSLTDIIRRIFIQFEAVSEGQIMAQRKLLNMKI